MNLLDKVTRSAYPSEQSLGVAGMATQARPVTLAENLQFRRDAKQRELDDLDEALKALKSNPELERVLELLSRV